MKKMIIIVSVLVIVLSCLAACTNPAISDQAKVARLYEEMKEKETMYKEQIEELQSYIEDNQTYLDSNKEKAEEKPKKYVLMGIKDKSFVPTLTFYDEERTFSFYFDQLSNDILEGNFDTVDNTIVANTYDDKFHYTFEIMDETSLKFIAEKSSIITLTNKSIGYQVEDQTVFKLEQ